MLSVSVNWAQGVDGRFALRIFTTIHRPMESETPAESIVDKSALFLLPQLRSRRYLWLSQFINRTR